MPPGVWRAIATIASPAAVTPAGDALRSGEATCTEKLTFLVVVTSSAAHAPNSVSPPSGESTGPMLKSTPSATTTRSSACRAVRASARARLSTPCRKGCVAIRSVCTSYPASTAARLAALRKARAGCSASGVAGPCSVVPAVIVRIRKPPAGSGAGQPRSERANGVTAAAPSIASTSRRVQSFTWERNAPDRDTGPRGPLRRTAAPPRARPPPARRSASRTWR